MPLITPDVSLHSSTMYDVAFENRKWERQNTEHEDFSLSSCSSFVLLLSFLLLYSSKMALRYARMLRSLFKNDRIRSVKRCFAQVIVK